MRLQTDQWNLLTIRSGVGVTSDEPLRIRHDVHPVRHHTPEVVGKVHPTTSDDPPRLTSELVVLGEGLDELLLGLELVRLLPHDQRWVSSDLLAVFLLPGRTLLPETPGHTGSVGRKGVDDGEQRSATRHRMEVSLRTRSA
jgi:hypothetical protein